MPKPGPGPGGAPGTAETRLENAIKRWQRLVDRAKNLKDTVNVDVPPYSETFEDVVDRREDARDRVIEIVERHPNLHERAVALGFKAELLGAPPGEGWERSRPKNEGEGGGNEGAGGGGGGVGQGKGGGGGGGGNDGPAFRKHGPKWKLPGVRGKDFQIVRSPKGAQYAVYVMKFGDQKIRVGVRLPRNEEELAKYGIKKGEGRLLSKAQLKKFKRAGFADELEFHGEDRHPFQALQRKLRRAYQGTELFDHPDVMRTIIAQHLFGWSPAEFQNQLRNTKWYANTSEWQRSWQLDKKKGDREAVIAETRQGMIDVLENHYGFDWMKYVKPEDVKKVAAKIAAGEWGTSGDPTNGLKSWARAQERAAARIEGTPAWMNREQQGEETRAFANRPEDMFEELRNQAIDYLGYAGREKPILDRDTLMAWAEDLVTERKSDGDWAQFLRQQMKALHPYFDPNIAFTQQATAYKSLIEETFRNPIGWDDPLLRDLGGTDAKGKRTGDPLSLHDFEMRVRGDERAWQEGTRLWDEGINLVSQLENMFLGVT